MRTQESNRKYSNSFTNEWKFITAQQKIKKKLPKTHLKLDKAQETKM